MHILKYFLAVSYITAFATFAQQENNGPSITGNMETTFQFLNEDTLIGANQPPSIGLVNSYMNVFYRQSNFKAGVRVESYLPRIQGYPNNFDGTGLGMRYVGYENDLVDITLGHFYEQFGAGLIFRAYEDRGLGFDNAMDGMRLVLRPIKGLTIKGVYGRNRYQFLEGRIVDSDGLVRGADAQFHLNKYLPFLDSNGFDVVMGASLVSKYQVDNNSQYILPENVGSYGGRMKIRYKKFFIDGEYIHKENDPSADNGYIYNSGHASLINFGYSTKGLGLVLSAKSVDNMSFRSDRTKDLTNTLINFLPAMNKTHTYNLVASLYPYATQPVGEMAYQGEVLYTIPKGSKLGGRYGMSINVNYSVAYAPVRNYDSRSYIDNQTGNRVAYDSSRVMYDVKPFVPSDDLYWQDANIQISRKFNKKFNMVASYYNISVNNDVAAVAQGPNSKGIIRSDIAVLEMGYKINRKNFIRTELQGLWTDKDFRDWATLVVEYNLKPGIFFSVMDQYNYGNADPNLRIHYLIGTVGYAHEATRLTLSYGRQRAGLFCVGGVCRFVPASNGLTVNFTQSF